MFVNLTLLILHFIGLALGVGASFALVTLRASTQKLEPAERAQFMSRASVLSKNGSIGLAILLLSGLAMLLVRGPAEVFAWGGGAFHAKLTLVVILCGVLGFQQVTLKKAREAGGGPLLARASLLGSVMLGLSLAIVVCAVIAFK